MDENQMTEMQTTNDTPAVQEPDPAPEAVMMFWSMVDAVRSLLFTSLNVKVEGDFPEEDPEVQAFLDKVLQEPDSLAAQLLVQNFISELFKHVDIGDFRQAVLKAMSVAGYGQHDANWLAFYDYFRIVCGFVEETAPLEGLTELAKCANWWYPHQKICWVCERPNTLHRDPAGRLHCPTGPALRYPDGFSVWAWHGVRVSRDIIEKPETITVQKIEGEENAEMRRILLEIYGLDRYLMDSGAEEIHKDDYGTLYVKEIPDDEPLVMVKVVNSTPEPDGSFKDYFMRVPPECAGRQRLAGSAVDEIDNGRKYTGTAKDAVAWTNRQTDKTYNPIIET